MPFVKEKEMYDILADWLKNREINPCQDTIVDKKEDWSYSFHFGGKRHRVDVIGLYTYEDNIRFVGIEAKLKPKKVLSASRQALPLANFCHEVYVAVPEKSYRKLSSRGQAELRSQLLKMYTGLLLVKETGKVKVTSEIPMEPIPFSLDLHQEAERHFRWNFDIDKLLEIFRSKVGKRGLGWLQDDWKTGEDDDSYYWVHNNYRGRVSFRRNSIIIDVNIEVDKFLFGVATTYHSLAYRIAPISSWIEDLESLVEDEQLVSLPRLVSMRGFTIDIDLLDEDRLPNVCSLLRIIGGRPPALRAELARPVILKPNYREEDFIDTIRLVYDRLLKIAQNLESIAWFPDES